MKPFKEYKVMFPERERFDWKQVDANKNVFREWYKNLFAEYPDLTTEQFDSFYSCAYDMFGGIYDHYDVGDCMLDTVVGFVKEFFEPVRTSNS